MWPHACSPPSATAPNNPGAARATSSPKPNTCAKAPTCASSSPTCPTATPTPAPLPHAVRTAMRTRPSSFERRPSPSGANPPILQRTASSDRRVPVQGAAKRSPDSRTDRSLVGLGVSAPPQRLSSTHDSLSRFLSGVGETPGGHPTASRRWSFAPVTFRREDQRPMRCWTPARSQRRRLPIWAPRKDRAPGHCSGFQAFHATRFGGALRQTPAPDLCLV